MNVSGEAKFFLLFVGVTHSYLTVQKKRICTFWLSCVIINSKWIRVDMMFARHNGHVFDVILSFHVLFLIPPYTYTFCHFAPKMWLCEFTV